jgi:acetyl-CoA carboxylase biotin carboxyl carrier protein
MISTSLTLGFGVGYPLAISDALTRGGIARPSFVCKSLANRNLQNITRSCDQVVRNVEATIVNAKSSSVNEKTSFESLLDINEVIELAKEFNLADFRLEENGVTIELTMPGGRGFKDGKLLDPPVPVAVPMGAPSEIGQAQQEMFEAEAGDSLDDGEDSAQFYDPSQYADEEAPSVEEPDEDGAFPSDFCVTSNRVGFFFSGGKNKPALVNVDDHVKFNQPVCIIEQLGQQYVYLSEVSGTVVKIFVEDGDPVEYGAKVMLIRPD